MHGDARDRMSYDELWRILTNLDAASFTNLRDMKHKGMVGFAFGKRFEAALTEDVLQRAEKHRAEQEREKLRVVKNAMIQDMAKNHIEDFYINSLAGFPPSKTPLPPITETTRERELRNRAERAEAELENLKRRFKTLFTVPADVVSTDVSADPKTPGQWRIRLHVAPFTIDTTMADLTAARLKPTFAASWGENLRKAGEAMQAAAHEQWKVVATHIATYPHPITSLEGPASEEPVRDYENAPELGADSKRGFR